MSCQSFSALGSASSLHPKMKAFRMRLGLKTADYLEIFFRNTCNFFFSVFAALICSWSSLNPTKREPGWWYMHHVVLYNKKKYFKKSMVILPGPTLLVPSCSSYLWIWRRSWAFSFSSCLLANLNGTFGNEWVLSCFMYFEVMDILPVECFTSLTETLWQALCQWSIPLGYF